MADDLPEADRRKEYIERVKLEKDNLDASYSVSLKLLEDELVRMNNSSEPINKSDSGQFLKLHDSEPIKLSNRLYIPIKEYPKFNFVGKLLGTRGVTLKALQSATRSRICIYGQGSTRDKVKEASLLASGDSKYMHLSSPLHIFVEVVAQPLEASNIMSFALKELSFFLDPKLQVQTLKYPGTSMPNNVEAINSSGGGTMNHVRPLVGINGGNGGNGGGPGGNMNCGPGNSGNKFMVAPSPMDQQQGGRQMYNPNNGGCPPSMNNNMSQQHGSLSNNNMNTPRPHLANNTRGQIVNQNMITQQGGGGGVNNNNSNASMNNSFNHQSIPMDSSNNINHNSRTQKFSHPSNHPNNAPNTFNKQKETFTYNTPGNSFNSSKSNFSTRGNFKKDGNWRGNQGNRTPFQPY